MVTDGIIIGLFLGVISGILISNDGARRKLLGKPPKEPIYMWVNTYYELSGLEQPPPQKASVAPQAKPPDNAVIVSESDLSKWLKDNPDISIGEK